MEIPSEVLWVSATSSVAAPNTRASCARRSGSMRAISSEMRGSAGLRFWKASRSWTWSMTAFGAGPIPPVWKYRLSVEAGISARARATHASCGRPEPAGREAGSARASRPTGTIGASASAPADRRRKLRRLVFTSDPRR